MVVGGFKVVPLDPHFTFSGHSHTRLELSNRRPKKEIISHFRMIIYIYDADLVWQMQLMIIQV